MKTDGYAATAPNQPLTPYAFERRELRANDVALEILYSGICHTDLHFARNDWGFTQYPLVPGHEIIGRITAVGTGVKQHRVGDAVAVGTMVDACLACDQCRAGEEQMCRAGATYTFGGIDRVSGERTQGGFAKHIVLREEFAIPVPKGLDLTRAAPLLCGGITVYSPLRTWKVGPGSRVGVVGLGGLGHLAVKFAAALGAHVTVLSRTNDKLEGALALGADGLLVSSDEAALTRAASSFDVMIDTVPYKHDLSPYVPLLDVDGTLVIVGQLGPVAELDTFPLIAGRRRIAGSPSGGLRETREMFDFCARKNVLPDVETIGLEQVNEAFARLDRSDVRYRFVIDMTALEGGEVSERRLSIGVIGSGLIGGAIARLAGRAGHDVMVANSRSPETLAELARNIGAKAVWAREAATAEDIVVMSIPPKGVMALAPEVLTRISDRAAIVDTVNYYPRARDGIIREIEDGLLESEWVGRRLGRPVVKAFNMIKARSLATGGTERGTPRRIAISLAGDDAEKRARVALLIDQIGFDPVDAGALSESWRMQPGTIGYCHDYDESTLRAALAATNKARLAIYREEADDFALEQIRRLGSVDAVGRA